MLNDLTSCTAVVLTYSLLRPQLRPWYMCTAVSRRLYSYHAHLRTHGQPDSRAACAARRRRRDGPLHAPRVAPTSFSGIRRAAHDPRDRAASAIHASRACISIATAREARYLPQRTGHLPQDISHRTSPIVHRSSRPRRPAHTHLMPAPHRDLTRHNRTSRLLRHPTRPSPRLAHRSHRLR